MNKSPHITKSDYNFQIGSFAIPG